MNLKSWPATILNSWPFLILYCILAGALASAANQTLEDRNVPFPTGMLLMSLVAYQLVRIYIEHTRATRAVTSCVISVVAFVVTTFVTGATRDMLTIRNVTYNVSATTVFAIFGGLFAILMTQRAVAARRVS